MVIFHLIDNFKRGGAETLLYHVVKNLDDHTNYVITLTDEIDFSSAEMQGLNHISLGYKSLTSLPKIILRLKKLISKLNPEILHAHLPFSSLVARLSTPLNIKLIISIHNNYSDSFKKLSPRLFFLEKKLHSKRDNLLFVSDSIRKDYDQIVGIKGNSKVLYNFIADKYFAEENGLLQNPGAKGKLRLVSVGSLKKQKNFDTVIKAFSLLDAGIFSIDILGEGPERNNLEKLIADYQTKNVQLLGAVQNVETYLKNYDGYILASHYEGFGIAPLEAAAVGLPLLLSDIDVFKEVTGGNATYFSPNEIKDLAAKLNNFFVNYEIALSKATSFRQVAKENFSRVNYIHELNKMYYN